MRKRADQLAGMGFVAFAVDMYGKGKVTEHPEDAAGWAQQIRGNIDLWRKRAMAGLEVLKADPRTDITRIAAIGYCFGGSTVQQLAYAGAPLRGIVSFHGGLVKPSQEEAKAVIAKILICHGARRPVRNPAGVAGLYCSYESGRPRLADGDLWRGKARFYQSGGRKVRPRSARLF